MKNKNSNNGLVYSTDPNFKIDDEVEEVETLAPNLQKLRVWLDTKHRAGKVATLITGFIGKQSDIDTLGKTLKNFCGAGGAVKDFEIIIQGDHREKVIQHLLKLGYSNTKKAGG